VLVTNQKPCQIQDTLRRSQDKTPNYRIPMPTLPQIQAAVRHFRHEFGGCMKTVAQLRMYLEKNKVIFNISYIYAIIIITE